MLNNPDHKHHNQLSLGTRAIYSIQLDGVLDPSWAEELGGMEIYQTSRGQDVHVTTLIGELVDQAALLGVLNMVYTLGLPLLSMAYLGRVDQGGRHSGSTPVGTC
ncbi:MAG: hypothetical protein U9R25_10815 [Chloroflexota bacterium]|nr:hypothetical protein [Chloroflexota bacterium]